MGTKPNFLHVFAFLKPYLSLFLEDFSAFSQFIFYKLAITDELHERGYPHGNQKALKESSNDYN
jgi:hypothetical protein